MIAINIDLLPLSTQVDVIRKTIIDSGHFYRYGDSIVHLVENKTTGQMQIVRTTKAVMKSEMSRRLDFVNAVGKTKLPPADAISAAMTDVVWALSEPKGAVE